MDEQQEIRNPDESQRYQSSDTNTENSVAGLGHNKIIHEEKHDEPYSVSDEVAPKGSSAKSAILSSVRSDNEAHLLTDKILKDAGFKDSVDEFREQVSILYLLCKEGASESFLRTLFCNVVENDSVKVDLIHCAAILFDEEYALELNGKDFSLQEFRDSVTEHSALKKFHYFNNVDSKAGNLAELKEVYDRHISFLKEQQLRLESIYNDRIKEREDLHEKNINMKQENFNVQLDAKDKDLSRVQGELDVAKNENNSLRTLLEQQKEATNAAIRGRDKARNELEFYKFSLSQSEKAANLITSENDQEIKRAAKERKGLFSAFRNLFSDKEEISEEVEQVIVSDKNRILDLISNPKFSVEQLEMIKKALSFDLPIDALEKICRPNIPATNMDMMINYMVHLNSVTQNNEDKEEENEDADTNKNSQ